MFSLVVDDFGVQYIGKEHAQHLYEVLNQKYQCTSHWEGKKYCGLNIEWNYEEGWVDIFIEGFAEKGLQ